VKKVSWEKSGIDSCFITVLVEDTLHKMRMGLGYKHGLALMIEAVSKNVSFKMLFDVGPSPEILLRNVETLHVKLNEIDIIILSHGHYDHTEGLLELLPYMRNRLPVVVHPKIFDPKFSYKPNLRYIGPGFNRSSIKDRGGVLVSTYDSVPVSNGILTSGEIPFKSHFERVRGFWKVEDCRFMEDTMVDEQALFINLRGKGLIVIVGCAHRGIINSISQAMQLMNEEKLFALIGGFHLSGVSDTIIQKTIDELVKIAPHHIYPCHCTGSKAVTEIKKVFGEKCQPLHTGYTFKI
jgi:7,8-dihydropterin-6-yl-methyl-4-(beta-D-ribofuranosyl)aminobenzene 5'-phosphate synthase